MARKEFPKAVKIAVVKRARRDDGTVICEGCGLPALKWQIDHINPDGLTGKPVIENAQLLGECCYSVKNPQDASTIAKAKRREAKHILPRQPTKQPIQSAGFPRKERASKISLPPRQMYRDASA